MSVTILATGQRRTDVAILATTSPTVVFQGRQNQRDLIVDTSIFNAGAGNCDYTVTFNDGTTTAKVLSGTLAANAFAQIDFPFAFTRAGETLSVEASVAGSLHVTLTSISAIGTNEPPEGFNL